MKKSDEPTNAAIDVDKASRLVIPDHELLTLDSIKSYVSQLGIDPEHAVDVAVSNGKEGARKLLMTQLHQIKKNLGPTAKMSATGRIFCERDKTFIVPAAMQEMFKAIRNEMDDNGFTTNTLLIGPSGCGKTESVKQFAAADGLPYLRMNCALLREPRDWFGWKDIRAGETVFTSSEFTRAITEGNCVILMDEINRAAPGVLNALFGLLDNERATFIQELNETVVVGENVYFFATANIGGEYSDTRIMDRALRSRFGYQYEVSYLKPSEEAALLVKRTGLSKEIASRLAKFAYEVRDKASGTGATITKGIDTRALLNVANAYNRVGPSCVDFTVSPLYSPEGEGSSERALVLQIWQGQGLNTSKTKAEDPKLPGVQE